MSKSTRLATLLTAIGALTLVLPACGTGGTSPSTDASLSALALSAGTLAPTFDSGTTMYSATVGLLVTSTTVTPTATDANASVTVNGALVSPGNASSDIVLAVGPTPVLIVVTAADGTTQKTYTVVVTRAATLMQEDGYRKASNADEDDGLGISVALSGDTLAVGAYSEASSATDGEADNSAPGAGAVYLFTRTGSSWTQQAILKASNAEAGDQFGWAVALEGDTLVATANTESSSAAGGEIDNSAAEAGAAYVFTRMGTTWSQQAYLKASNAEAGDWFGWTLALSGDTLVVTSVFEGSNGVDGEADNSAPEAGAAYVFTRTVSTWSQQAYLKASNPDGGDHFGTALAIRGDTLVATSWNESSSVLGGQSDNSVASSGAAYVFTRTGSAWTQQAFLKSSNVGVFDLFGSAAALSGDTLVIGAYGEGSSALGGEGDDSAAFAGAAYVFTRTGATWSQQAYLKASNAEADDLFGGSVALVGDTLVVGAPSEGSSATGGQADNSALISGAAYVFTRSGSSWAQHAYLKASNADFRDQFGQSVALSGDTLVVGAVFEQSSAAGGEMDNSENGAGAAYVLR